MSSASLAIAHRPHPDAMRIAGISAAIALNLALILVVSRPIGAALFTPQPAVLPATQIRLIDPPKEIPPPPILKIKPIVHPPVAPVVHTQPRVTSPPAVVPTDQGNVAAPPITVTSLAPTSVVSAPAIDATPVEASLAYRSAPLKFPPQALRQHMQGSVMLRVLVNEAGKPVEVVIEKSSGYSLLDRSAREQVLASWLFQPAMVDGHAARAWARVPVTFDLHQE